jgi:hypothetical protein
MSRSGQGMEAESRVALGDLEDNDLASGTIAIVDRIRPHLGTILLAALVLFAALAAWTLVRSQRAAQRTAAWDACLAALAGGDPAGLEEVVARYAGSAAAQWAELVLADTALADGNRLLLSDAQRGRRRLEEAAGRYTAVNAQRPEQLAAERAILGLARARESLGELAEARSGYEALAKEYPDSPFRPLAEERAAALARASTERWYSWLESRQAAAPADVPAEPAASEPAAEKAAPDEPAAVTEPAEPADAEPADASKPAEPAAEPSAG